MKRWKQRPEGSAWGDYGADDTLGRLRELTPERVVRAAAEIREGRRFCLSLPLDYPGGNTLHPNRFPPIFEAVDRDGTPTIDYPLHIGTPGAQGVVNDDVVRIWTQYSTQWDGLAHIGTTFDANGDGAAETVYFNGHYPGPDVANMAEFGVQGRGVMVDLFRRYGLEHTAVTYAMLSEVMREQHVSVEAGDILTLHTGMGQAILDAKKAPSADIKNNCAALDGRDTELHAWIRDTKIAAIVSDNFAVEVHPARPSNTPAHGLPLHELCLFKLGVNLGEIWYLTELAAWLGANSRNRFFLTAAPLRLPGSPGSPVTPIATV